MHLWRQAKAVSTSYGLFFTLTKKVHEPLGAHTPIYPVFTLHIVHFKPMSCSKQMPSHISFAEIIHGRDSTVRVTHDNKIYAVDLIMVMTGKDRDHAGQTLRGISEEKFSSLKISERNTGGSGNSKTKLVSFEHALELIMVLPGSTAKETRVQFANIIRRYMAGDESMHAEIQANSVSSSPIAQMARESLGLQVVEDEHSVGFKRRREELEVLRMELEISTMRVNCYKQEEEARSMAQARILSTTAELERIRDPLRSNLDDRTRLMIQDALQNTILNSMHQGSLTITNGHSLSLSTSAINNNNGITNNNSTNAPISISSVAAELGYKPSSADAKRIGIDIKKRYMKLHNNQAPPKHDQLCDGRVTQVNSYTNKDRPILVEALRAYFSPPSLSSSGDSCDF